MTQPQPWDIPGLLRGIRWSNEDPRFYDSSKVRFPDLAGYDALGNGAELIVGTVPTFGTHGTNLRTGILCDRSTQWRLENVIPFEGAGLIVFKPVLVSNTILYVRLFGKATSAGSNGRIQVQKSGTNFNLTVATSGGSLSKSIAINNNAINLVAYAINQQDRQIHLTTDGVSIISSAADPGTVNGNAASIGFYSSGQTIDGGYMRVGDNDNGTTTANATDYDWEFEHWEWKGDPLHDAASTMQALIADKRNYYGI